MEAHATADAQPSALLFVRRPSITIPYDVQADPSAGCLGECLKQVMQPFVRVRMIEDTDEKQPSADRACPWFEFFDVHGRWND
jgi:hypothetical protein